MQIGEGVVGLGSLSARRPKTGGRGATPSSALNQQACRQTVLHRAIVGAEGMRVALRGSGRGDCLALVAAGWTSSEEAPTQALV